MKDKKNLLYIVIILVLVTILGLLWFLIINNSNTNNYNNYYNNSGPGMNNSSCATYSSVKEITTYENITSGEYKSTNASENAFWYLVMLNQRYLE